MVCLLCEADLAQVEAADHGDHELTVILYIRTGLIDGRSAGKRVDDGRRLALRLGQHNVDKLLRGGA